MAGYQYALFVGTFAGHALRKRGLSLNLNKLAGGASNNTECTCEFPHVRMTGYAQF